MLHRFDGDHILETLTLLFLSILMLIVLPKREGIWKITFAYVAGYFIASNHPTGLKNLAQWILFFCTSLIAALILQWVIAKNREVWKRIFGPGLH